MSQTQSQRPKRSHTFFMKVILAVFVLIFAGVIGFSFIRNMMIGKFLANMPESTNPVTALEIKPSEWTPVIKEQC